MQWLIGVKLALPEVWMLLLWTGAARLLAEDGLGTTAVACSMRFLSRLKDAARRVRDLKDASCRPAVRLRSFS